MAWIMVGDQLTNTDFPALPGKPFVGDSPYTMWRIDPNANDGMPYLGLMIGLPVLAPEPEPPMYIEPVRPLIHVYDCKALNDDYNTNGYAIIEPISCAVKQEENGRYDVTLTAYCDEEGRFKYLKKQAQLKVPIVYHGQKSEQIFRIYDVRRQMDRNGRYRIICYATHKFYDLNWFMIRSLSVSGNGQTVLDTLMTTGWYGGNQEDMHDLGYSWSSDITRSINNDYANCYVLEALLGDESSITYLLNGKLYRDNGYFSVNEVMENSVDIGIIEYGYNMTEIDFEEDDSERITVLICDDNYGHTRTMTISKPISQLPDVPHHRWGHVHFDYNNELLAPVLFSIDTTRYFRTYKDTKVSIKVNFADLPQSKEYKEFASLAAYEVGDRVTIYHKDLNIYYKNLEIVSKTYDVVSQKTTAIEVGGFRNATTRK